MKFKKIYLLFCFVAFFIANQAFAQTNYSDIKVDNLSDAQIRQLIQRAESIGYNDAQLEQMAAAQGMKEEEIKKLRSRVEKIRKQEGASTTAGTKDINRSRSYSENSKDTTKKAQGQLPEVNNFFEPY